mmetsp:Transcript_54944/g.112190  ORF Transcript_54944/g.112190 Transcript_54944/m.112190 type:complete len:92 (-) Transcript_54944:827-1102(-)
MPVSNRVLQFVSDTIGGYRHWGGLAAEAASEPGGGPGQKCFELKSADKRSHVILESAKLNLNLDHVTGPGPGGVTASERGASEVDHHWQQT